MFFTDTQKISKTAYDALKRIRESRNKATTDLVLESKNFTKSRYNTIFPEYTDDKFKGIDSKILLKKITSFVNNVGYELVNIDITIIAQKPKINPHKNEIKSSLSKLLNLPKQFINIKASTAEKLGAVGREEGVVVQAMTNLRYYDWTK